MKKILLWSIALISIIGFSACSSDDGVSGLAEGRYAVTRVTNMVGLPPTVSFTPLKDEVSLSIDAVADYFVDVTLPSTKYVFNGQNMEIPALVLENIPVISDNENGVYFPNHTFKQDNGKYIEGTITGEIEEDGDVELTVQYKYGSMPFQINKVFTDID